MRMHAMDTHKAIQEFLAAGVEQPVAEVMVAAIDGAVSEHMLTKDELEAVKAAAIEELASKEDLEAIAGELHLVKSDTAVLKDDVAALKDDTAVLKKDAAVLSVKVDGLEDAMQEHRKEFRQHRQEFQLHLLENNKEHARLEALIKSEIGQLRNETNANHQNLRNDMAKWKNQMLLFLGGGLVASTLTTIAVLGFLGGP